MSLTQRPAPSADLLFLLYKAAADGDVLRAFLQQISQESSSHNVALLVQDLVNPERSSFTDNVTGRDRALGYGPVAAKNIYLEAALPHMAPGKVLRSNTLMRDEDILNSEFYKVYCQQIDVFHSMSAVLRADDEYMIALVFGRERSAPFTKDDQQWLESLVPHLVSYAHIQEKLRGLEASRSTAWEGMNHLAFGIYIIDSEGRPVFANSHLQELVEASDALHWHANHLAADAPQLANWLKAVPAQFADACPGPFILRAGLEHLQFIATPLQLSTDHSASSDYMVLVQDLTNPTLSLRSHLQSLYGLTAREAQVAEGLIGGLGVKQIAGQAGLAPSTVITHKKNLFQKMNIRRQSELIRVGLALNIGLGRSEP